jgi:tetratricopeptide (TPR) repeat protein
MYLRRGYLQSAAETWIAAIDAAPDADAFVGLAQVALAQQAYDDAHQFALTALELDPASAAARRLRDGAASRLDRGIAA